MRHMWFRNLEPRPGSPSHRHFVTAYPNSMTCLKIGCWRCKVLQMSLAHSSISIVASMNRSQPSINSSAVHSVYPRIEKSSLNTLFTNNNRFWCFGDAWNISISNRWLGHLSCWWVISVTFWPSRGRISGVSSFDCRFFHVFWHVGMCPGLRLFHHDWSRCIGRCRVHYCTAIVSAVLSLWSVPNQCHDTRVIFGSTILTTLWVQRGT